MLLNETIHLVATPRRNDGSLGAIQDVPVWASDSASVTLTPSADGLTCDALGAAVGSAVITCSATNTVDAPVSGTFAVEVVLGPADLIEITQVQ